MNKVTKLRYMSNQYGNSVFTNSIYVYHNDAQKFFYIGVWGGDNLYKRVASNVIPKMGLLDYKAVSNGDLYDFISNDKTVSLGYPGMYDNFIMVRDLSFNGNTEKFKQFIIGNNVWFELETPTQGGYLPINKTRYMSNKYGNIDLSTLEWSKEELNFVSTPLPNAKIPTSDIAANMICSKYRSVPLNNSFVEGDFAINPLGWLYVRDTKYGDVISFKESLKNLILTYELATDNSGGYLPYTKLKYKASDVCQLFDKDKFFATRTAHGVVFTNNGDGSFTINGTCDANADADTPLFLPPVDYSVMFDLYSVEGHKYLLIPLPQAFSYSTLRFIFGSEATAYYETSKTYEIYTATKTGTYPCYAIYRVGAGTTINNLTVKPQLFDLTEMYGAGNEPTTLAEFRQKYPNDLYPYSPQCWY